MPDQPLNRREFLRLSLALTGSALATACQGSIPTPTPSPKGQARIYLDGGDVDVWADRALVWGRLENPAACQAVWIDNGSARMQAALKDKSFSASILIYPGANSLRAICQQADKEEQLSPQKITLTGRLEQRPTALIIPSLSQGHIALDGASSMSDKLEHQPIKEYIWTPCADNPVALRVRTATDKSRKDFTGEIKADRIELELPGGAPDGEYYFSLRVVDEAGREDSSVTYFVVSNGQARIPDYDHENTAWVESAIVYGVIPRLFGTPGAKAIEEKLDYLADLGVNALWLAPINETNDYGYSVINYFELRDNFGSKEDFRALIQAAHERGIRILMDFVPNHTSNKHPYFLDTLEKGTESSYWDFYDRDEQGNYTYYFDWTHLPNLNYDHPEVHRMMIEAFSYWVREFDVDGFRVDACWGVQERRPDFWPEWRRALKRIKPDLLLLAEASARDPYNFDNGFDAAYDWTGELGHWAWGQFWGEQAPDVKTPEMIDLLKAALTNQKNGYHPDALIFRFLNNNDTGTRFISTHGEALTRIATALLLTVPGVPCIYTADEVGQWFRPYSDTAPLSFKERYPGLRDYHKKLIGLRKEIPSLHSRLWQILEVEPADQVLGYIRFMENHREPVLVLLNFSKEEAAVKLTLPEEFSTWSAAGRLSDLLNGEIISFTGSIPMAPMSARILTPKNG